MAKTIPPTLTRMFQHRPSKVARLNPVAHEPCVPVSKDQQSLFGQTSAGLVHNCVVCPAVDGDRAADATVFCGYVRQSVEK
jgi:hypothetical protein